jgi:hypothetical protein
MVGQMGILGGIFRGKGGGSEIRKPLLTFEIGHLCFDEAEKYFTESDGDLFLEGMRLAFQPLDFFVRNNASEREFTFMETINEYAKRSFANPENVVATMWCMRFKDEKVSAGYRCVSGLLILGYACSNKVYLEGSALDQHTAFLNLSARAMDALDHIAAF